jgi:uncharacterized protein YgbK (DUF1537 family)
MTVLPPGPLVAWYGDDFTGAAATMEAMSFAGLPAAVFFAPPSTAMLSKFPGLRGIGIAGTARSQTPAWMHEHLPALLKGLQSTGAPLLQYKICSTLDSSPSMGSIGTAMDVAHSVLGCDFFPILPAAPPMGRYQVFGTLFASAQGGVYRLDRHPVMSRHPITPMNEADVAQHLSDQTSIPLATLPLAVLRGEGARAWLEAQRHSGRIGITLDALSADDMAAVGRLLWEMRDERTLCIASQGLQYALIEFWRREGVLPPQPPAGSAGYAGPIAVVSGSVSSTTAAQIAHAEADGFAVIALDAAALIERPEDTVSEAVASALPLLASGTDVLFCTARGPDDPAVAAFNAWTAAHGIPAGESAGAIGAGLGEILRLLVGQAGLRRAVVSGGDTSGHAVRRLGLEALTALAPTIPGAGLCIAHASDRTVDGMQLALKGGQMGTPDYFSWIRSGAGRRD